MAGVATKTKERIDWLLNDLTQRWETAPEVARAIDTWDTVDQLRYTEEWMLHFDKLQELREAEQAGLLSGAQRSRYEHLEYVVEANLPALREILR